MAFGIFCDGAEDSAGDANGPSPAAELPRASGGPPIWVALLLGTMPGPGFGG